MSDRIARLDAALEARYRIDREVGEGGMATVYLALDLRHERHVALKVLRPELAAAVGADRFLAEIRTTANLQHPHILPLFDSGEADSFLYYVMPYVAGESLRERLDRERQLGVEDAIELARKVAGALDYAHTHGVVHRDIKPGNILLSEQGEPLVADFGIALALAHAGGGRLTETGLSLGTPHYMSPEQATGEKSVDARSDVYSLACVLYEMLAGQPPFTAPSAQAVIARILTAEAPAIIEQRRTVPGHVAAVIAKALEKLPADRFRSAADFAAALASTSFTYSPRSQTPSGTPAAGRSLETGLVSGEERWKRRALASTAAAIVLAGLAAWGWLRPRPQLQDLAATIDLSGLTWEHLLMPWGEILVSPDGTRFAAFGMRYFDPIYWRPAGEAGFRPIPGTEGTRDAGFSPDGESIVFATYWGGTLQRARLSGGAPSLVTNLPLPQVGGLHWGDDGTVVFAGQGGFALYRVPATGGQVRQLLPDGQSVRSPRVLPGGRHVIFTDEARGGTSILDLETDSVRVVLAGAIDASYIETGHLLYADVGGTLWAVPFDARSGTVTGDANPLVVGVSMLAGSGARYSASATGVLVYGTGYVPSDVGNRIEVVHFDGRRDSLDVRPGQIDDVAWSPDGSTIAYARADSLDESAHIWIYDLESQTAPQQLTFEGDNRDPVFSPDGVRLVFRSRRAGTLAYDLFAKSLLDDAPEQLLIALPGYQGSSHWPANDTIVFQSSADSALWVLDLSDPDSAIASQYLHGNQLYEFVVSPDREYAAYTEYSVQEEVYVRSFPVPGAPTRISEGEGFTPSWSASGDTIFYWSGALGPTNTLWAARVARQPMRVLSRDSVVATRGDVAVHAATRRVAAVVPNRTSEPQPERFIVLTNFLRLLGSSR